MKSLTLALCVLAILGSAASTFFYFQIGNTKAELKQQVAAADSRAGDLQNKLTEAGAQGEALQKRLAALDGDLGEAKSKATAAETRSTQLSRDVAQLKNQITAKEDAEQSLNREIADLKRELAQAKLAASAATPEEVATYKTTIATLQARVNELEASRSNTVASIPNTGAATGSAVSSTSAAPAAAGEVVAEVVSVGAKNAFVVVNAGAEKGVQVNQQFNIVRDGATVAKASVTSVEPAYAVALVAADSLKSGLLKGDKVSPAQ